MKGLFLRIRRLGRVNILNLDKNDYFICSSQMVKVIIILEEVVGFLIACQDILKLISNLKNKKLIKQASLANMNLSNQSQGTQAMKGFKIACILEMI